MGWCLPAAIFLLFGHFPADTILESPQLCNMYALGIMFVDYLNFLLIYYLLLVLLC